MPKRVILAITLGTLILAGIIGVFSVLNLPKKIPVTVDISSTYPPLNTSYEKPATTSAPTKENPEIKKTAVPKSVATSTKPSGPETTTVTTSTTTKITKIIIGVTGNDSENKEDIDETKPLALYLAKKLTGSESNGEIVFGKDIVKMSELMRRGEINLFLDTPFPSAVIQKLSGGKIIASRAKGGVISYRSNIFVPTDSSVTQLKDLVGKIIAFESPDSTSNYFLPKVELLSAGFKVEPLDANGNVKTGTIGYYFTGDDHAIIPAVLHGEADAGGRNSVSYSKETSSLGTQLRIIKTTPYVYRSVMVASPKLTSGQLKEIGDVLFSMDSTAEGRAVLLKTGKTLFFRSIPENSPEMKTMQNISTFLEKEILETTLTKQ